MSSESEVFPLAQGPEDLDAKIARQHELIREHKATRPGHEDLAALTVWAQDHEILTTHLEVLQGQRARSWRPAPDRPVLSPMPATPPPPTPKNWRPMPCPAAVAPEPIPADPGPAPEPVEVPAPEPAPALEEPVKDLNLPPITPAQERLAKAVATYNAKLAKVKEAPGNRAARGQAFKWASTARGIAKYARPRLPEPQLEPLPELPDPKYGQTRKVPAMPPALKGRAKAKLEPVAPEPAQLPETAPAPGPEIRVVVNPGANLDELADRVRQVLPEAMKNAIQEVDRATLAGLGVHLPATTADLDARDRTVSRAVAPEQFARACDALETLRRIRRDTWLLLVQLADLPPGERAAYRPGLQAVIVGCESGIDLVDEAPLAQEA